MNWISKHTSNLYARIIPADRDRGYVVLLSWEKPVVQRTCTQMTTMGTISRAEINRVIAEAAAYYKAQVVDVTDPGLQKKLAKLFGEEPQKKDKTVAKIQQKIS